MLLNFEFKTRWDLNIIIILYQDCKFVVLKNLTNN